MGNRTNRGTFKPGHSGNPGGRPAVSAELRALARERTHEAMEVLTKIMQDPKAPAAARVAACRELFDRGYGRPESSLNAKVETPSTLTEDFDAFLAELSPEERGVFERISKRWASRSPSDGSVN
jgi:hypothetical protein